MLFRIDQAIAEKFPHVKLGILIAREINNQGHHEAIASMLRQAEEKLREKIPLDTLATYPKISDWRETYRSFGDKATLCL